jgi:Protein of unknown function (DUF3047)
MTRALALVVAAVLLLPALPPPSLVSAQGDCVTLDDFKKSKVGEFPADWKVRKDSGRQVYKVAEEGGVRFLRAVSKGIGIQAGRETKDWGLAARPVLAWSWRPRQFPKGADERTSKNDSALAVYMVVEHSRVAGPKAVKYIWSERVPVGTHLTSNNGLTQVRVLRSGPASGTGWTEERVNVLEDYRKYFADKGTPKPNGIAVLTDADDTKSSAAGDYANFRACAASAKS